MQIHQIKPKYKFKKRKRVGRGGKRGTYSGKGMKGQNARSGSGGKNIVEKGRSSWIKRFPKLGGFTAGREKNIIVKSGELEKFFQASEEITPVSLLKKKLIESIKRGKTGKLQTIKILNSGEITKKLTIKNCLVSQKVKAMVIKAGGTVADYSRKRKATPKKPFKSKK